MAREELQQSWELLGGLKAGSAHFALVTVPSVLDMIRSTYQTVFRRPEQVCCIDQHMQIAVRADLSRET